MNLLEKARKNEKFRKLEKDRNIKKQLNITDFENKISEYELSYKSNKHFLKKSVSIKNKPYFTLASNI